jgi:beta-lactamase regulating signal transducer with metallopeptidase domain/Skp family chaperone for outer membrane proteins
MNEMSASLLPALARSGVLLTFSALVVALVLHACKIASPKLRRVACVAVLVQGCLFAQWRIAVPAGLLPARVPLLNEPFPSAAAASLARPGAANGMAAIRDSEAGAVRTTAIAVSTREQIPWPTGIVLAWGVGMIVLVVRGGWNYMRFVRETPPPLAAEASWIAEWESVQQEGGVHRNVALHVSENLGPMICCFPRGYRLIVPAGLWRRLTPPQRRAILRHELAHLERRDIWKSLAVRVLAIPHWFNPVVWWVVQEFDACAEFACDETACTDGPDRVADYARALVELSESARGSLLLRSGARGGGLADRVRRLLQPVSWEDSKMKKGLVLSLIGGLTLIGLVQIRLVAEQPRKAVQPAQPVQTTPRARRPQRAADRSSGREAVIDVAYLFRNLKDFERHKEKLQAEVERERTSFQSAAEELAKLHRNLAEAKGAAREQLEKEIAVKTAEIEAGRNLATKMMRQREAELYQKIYDRIRAEVARYAKEHRIRIVRRADLSAQREEQSTDSTDPQEIIKRMNQEIVFIERDELDITDAIFQRLNSSEAPAQREQEAVQR